MQGTSDKRNYGNEVKRQRNDSQTSSILELDPSCPGEVKYTLKSGCHLHMYISQLPCNSLLSISLLFFFKFVISFNNVLNVALICLSYIVGGYASTSSPLYALKKIPSTQVDDSLLHKDSADICSSGHSYVPEIGNINKGKNVLSAYLPVILRIRLMLVSSIHLVCLLFR